MELVNFSVTNFRSITKAHKVSVSDTTVLIGRNNEGKSNLLRALDVAMTSLQRHALEHRHGRIGGRHFSRRDEKTFFWERDFPINLQERKSGTQTIIRLEFLLNNDEIEEFKGSIKSNLNGTLPIIIKIGKDSVPSIEVSKKGKGSCIFWLIPITHSGFNRSSFLELSDHSFWFYSITFSGFPESVIRLPE